MLTPLSVASGRGRPGWRLGRALVAFAKRCGSAQRAATADCLAVGGALRPGGRRVACCEPRRLVAGGLMSGAGAAAGHGAGYQTADDRRAAAESAAAKQRVADEQAAVRAMINQMKLSHASAAGSAAAVADLLDAGADAGTPDLAGLTPLHHAATNGEPAVIQLLVARGASLTAPAANAAGSAPLHCAAGNGQDSACAALLRLGADPSQRNLVSRRFAPAHPAVARPLGTRRVCRACGCRKLAGALVWAFFLPRSGPCDLFARAPRLLAAARTAS